LSAPASVHADTRAALLEIYQILRCAAQRARESRQPVQPALNSESAGQRRPLGAGARPTTHDDRVSPARDGAAIAEDDRHERVTSTDA
jgi:hypothetical protein